MSRWRTVRRFLDMSITGAWIACVLACATATKRPERAAQRPQTERAAVVQVRTALLDQLQGRWVAQSAGDQSEGLEWTVAGSTISAQTSGGQSYKGALKINDRVSPVQVDIQFSDCSDTSLNGQTMQGILKLEGKKVTFCFSDPGQGTRPTALDRSEGMLIVGEKK